MKAKHFFIVLCLLVGMGMLNVNAQSNNTRAFQYWWQSEYWSPIYCNGVMVDLLEGGVLRVHTVYLLKDGKYKWETDQLKGHVTSSATGEVFKVRELDKWYIDGNWFVTWHYHLQGNMGTTYMGSITQNYKTGEITVGNTFCH